MKKAAVVFHSGFFYVLKFIHLPANPIVILCALSIYKHVELLNR